MEKVFADANLLVEIIFQRPNATRVSQRIGKEGQWLFISALTAHIVYYLCERDHLDPQIARAALLPFLIVPVDQRVVELAQSRYSGRDFEDCLQAAAAEMASCQRILTLDQKFARLSGTSLPVEVIPSMPKNSRISGPSDLASNLDEYLYTDED